MKDDQQRGDSPPRDFGSRPRCSRLMRIERMTLLVFVLISMIFVFREIHRDCPLLTWDEPSTRIEKPVLLDSPGVQLVGNVTMTRHYGMFHFGSPSVCEIGVTVLYEDHRFFFVETTPDGFFASLLDKTRYPHIAIHPLEKHPIIATSATSADDEARRFLKSRSTLWD